MRNLWFRSIRPSESTHVTGICHALQLFYLCIQEKSKSNSSDLGLGRFDLLWGYLLPWVQQDQMEGTIFVGDPVARIPIHLLLIYVAVSFWFLPFFSFFQTNFDIELMKWERNVECKINYRMWKCNVNSVWFWWLHFLFLRHTWKNIRTINAVIASKNHINSIFCSA